jgi:SAM-dependent methyltransferase
MKTSGEISRIRDSYSRRHATYDPCSAWVYKTRQELERALIEVLRRAGMLPLGGRTLLEVGCGSGGNLLQFLRLGMEPEDLAGCELLEERANDARRRLPAIVKVECGDALSMTFEREFDVVFQSLVFSSILDVEFQAQLADKMWSLVKPGGGILWYDFTYDNPRNRDVAGVTVGRVRQLFPAARLTVRRVTLAPPISRIVTRIHPSMYSLVNVMPFLRTHVVCWLGKAR